MIEFLYPGSKVVMGLITASGVLMLALSAYSIYGVVTKKVNEKSLLRLSYVKEAGLFALMIGALATTIDLIGAFDAISQAGDIAPGLLAAGLKYTIMPITYGLVIFILALLFTMGLKWKVNSLAG